MQCQHKSSNSVTIKLGISLFSRCHFFLFSIAKESKLISNGASLETKDFGCLFFPECLKYKLWWGTCWYVASVNYFDNV